MSCKTILATLLVALSASHCFLYRRFGQIQKELDGVKAVQVGKHKFDKWESNDIRMSDYTRLCNTIGEVYGLETEYEQQRLIYWTLTITNGMSQSEKRMRIRNGLDGE